MICVNILEKKANLVRRRKKRNRKEFRLDAEVYGHDIKKVMLDLDFNVKILPENSWEDMEIPPLVWSLIQLCMDN